MFANLTESDSVGAVLYEFEEIGGRVELLDAPAVAEGGHGACVRLIFPQFKPPEAAAVPADESASEPGLIHGS